MSTQSPTKGSPLKSYDISYDLAISQISFLQGKILTIIDASVSGTQNKAIKDLIRQTFSQQMTYIAQLCFPDVAITSRDALIAEGLDVPEIESTARSS